MTINEMLGTPVSDRASPIRLSSVPCPIPTQPQPDENGERSNRTLLWSVLIAATSLCIGIAVGGYAIPRAGDPAAVLSAVAAQVDVPAGVAGFAELFAATHLSGVAAAEDLAVLYPDAAAPPAATGLWVNRAAAIAAVAVDEEVWRVTVATEVLEMVDGAYEPAGIQYYTVTVAQKDAQPVALSAPSRTPAPENVAQRAAAPRYAGAVPPDQERAVVDFLGAYLTGNGEVARYMAPTARIALFPVPPYVSTRMESIGADALGRVRARLTATSANGATQALEYTLEMGYASGVWEVLTLAPGTGQI